MLPHESMGAETPGSMDSRTMRDDETICTRGDRGHCNGQEIREKPLKLIGSSSEGLVYFRNQTMNL